MQYSNGFFPGKIPNDKTLHLLRAKGNNDTSAFLCLPHTIRKEIYKLPEQIFNRQIDRYQYIFHTKPHCR